MNTKANHWFSSAEEFRQTCSDAVLLSRGESAEEFAAQMLRMADQHGLQTYLSEKQARWLCLLADRVLPLPQRGQS